MEKLEALKCEEEGRLSREELNQITQDVLASLKKYQDFLRGLNSLADGSDTEAVREKIIRVLVRRIWITESGFKLEFHTGGDYMEWEQRQLEEEPVLPDNWDSDNNDDLPPDFGQKKSRNQFMVPGSNSLTNGGRSSAIPELAEPLMARLFYDERWKKKEIDLLELVTLRESGMTLREIALRLDVSKTRLHWVLHTQKPGKGRKDGRTHSQVHVDIGNRS